MTKIKCDNETIFVICKHLKDGICQLDEIELEFRLDGDYAVTHHMACANQDLIANKTEDYIKHKQSRI